jgi:hypothetical protein
LARLRVHGDVKLREFVYVEVWRPIAAQIGVEEP